MALTSSFQNLKSEPKPYDLLMLSPAEIHHRAQQAARYHPTVDALHKAMHDEVLPQAKSFRPTALWRTFQLSLKVDLEPLFDENLENHTNNEVPDCKNCTEHCCQGHGSDIRLRLIDLAYLKDANLLEGFIDDTEPKKNLHPEKKMVLSELLFSKLTRNEDKTCIFFHAQQCLIHSIRPLRCQRFPYRLDADKQGISYAKRCSSRQKGTPSEIQQLRAAVVKNYNAKLSDLVTLAHNSKKDSVLVRIGLSPWLPKPQDECI